MSRHTVRERETGLRTDKDEANGRQEGFYRRRIATIVEPGIVRAFVEDDFHHFRVTVRHNGTKVTAVKGEPVRFPWLTCPGASGMLVNLIGAPIETSMPRQPDAFDRFHQCTHQLELALLAIAQAARGRSRQYDIAISDADQDGIRAATVSRDGEMVEAWRLIGEQLVAPPEIARLAVRALRPWADALEDDRYERVAILRRCLQVSWGRSLAVRPDVASKVPGAGNACYAFQDIRRATGCSFARACGIILKRRTASSAT